MTSAKRIYLAVAGGLVAAGVVLGGVEVDDPTGLPLIEQLAEVGEVDTSGVAAPEAPAAP